MFSVWIDEDQLRSIKIISPLTTVDLLVCQVPLKSTKLLKLLTILVWI